MKVLPEDETSPEMAAAASRALRDLAGYLDKHFGEYALRDVACGFSFFRDRAAEEEAGNVAKRYKAGPINHLSLTLRIHGEEQP